MESAVHSQLPTPNSFVERSGNSEVAAAVYCNNCARSGLLTLRKVSVANNLNGSYCLIRCGSQYINSALFSSVSATLLQNLRHRHIRTLPTGDQLYHSYHRRIYKQLATFSKYSVIIPSSKCIEHRAKILPSGAER